MPSPDTVAALKGLVIDGVGQAGSGHPGGAMSSMDLACVLFRDFLRLNPDDPRWLGRDRFVLSAGHESMLLYSLLHGLGWLKREDLESFRQLHSRTPGHPENILTPGVECTTGPLGQGCAMSVGFAIAEEHHRAVWGKELIANHTWVLCGDGCMQEDITYGAASLAGHLGLSKLIWIYDRNRAQISGTIDRVTSDDEAAIYRALGWSVLTIDGHDHASIKEAYVEAAASDSAPTLIIADTVMAKGAATVEGSHSTHGAPLKPEEAAATKTKLGLAAEPFFWPEACKSDLQRRFPELRQQAEAWSQSLAAKKHADAAFAQRWDEAWELAITSDLPRPQWDKSKAIASRSAFGVLIDAWADAVPQLMGGSADLEPSNMTGAFAAKVRDFQQHDRLGRNLAFGVREFPMSAVTNGMALYGGLIPFDATFLTFSDYSRPALRLGALQQAKVIHEFTHDSFFLGEDGPTHQPIEHLMSLRAMPDMLVMRPADAIETEVLLGASLRHRLPSSMCLSRQNLPFLPLAEEKIRAGALQGAYAVRPQKQPTAMIFATGAEVGLALDVAKLWEQQKPEAAVEVVSVPCWELFAEQPQEYQAAVLKPAVRTRVTIEAGVTLGWERFALCGLTVGIDHYGASGKAKDLAEEFGFTPEKILQRIAAKYF